MNFFAAATSKGIDSLLIRQKEDQIGLSRCGHDCGKLSASPTASNGVAKENLCARDRLLRISVAALCEPHNLLPENLQRSKTAATEASPQCNSIRHSQFSRLM